QDARGAVAAHQLLGAPAVEARAAAAAELLELDLAGEALGVLVMEQVEAELGGEVAAAHDENPVHDPFALEERQQGTQRDEQAGGTGADPHRAAGARRP